ncbi:MAG TPA: zinc dependent phospholipase C family protein [Bacteroidia bacterium]|jgi:hypothetical protein|nr:zinc dependent phospholipase C family protein [Bacteroidia bacterium]
MIRKYFFLLILFPCFLFVPNSSFPVYSWGFFAHQKINRLAVFTLPNGMIGFYKQHIDYISQHATDPDKRRYINEEEAARHYIDIDHYGKTAFDSVPHYWKKAVAKYSEDTLKAYGIVPWHIDKMIYRLTEAFKTENLDLILKYSSDLGHYVADAHVPLHTTENYNGQLTNQKGIHGLWESRIPELKSEGYNYWTGAATYIDNSLETAWNIVKESHSCVDSVLTLEKELSNNYPSDKKYSIENRGKVVTTVYSQEYTNEYNRLLNGMVERRLRAAILCVGSLWYTAWINAGQPDLDKLANKEVSDSLKKINDAEELRWKDSKKMVSDHEE